MNGSEFLDNGDGSIYLIVSKFILENKIKENSDFFSKLEDVDILSFIPSKYALFFLSALHSFKQYGETGEEIQKPIFLSLLDKYKDDKRFKEFIVDWSSFVAFLRNYVTHVSFETALSLFQKTMIQQDAAALLQFNLDKVQNNVDSDIYDIFPISVPNIATKVSSGFISPKENMEEMEKELLVDVETTAKKYITLGYAELDNLTVYKMEEGGVSIVSGRSGAGKTTLKCNMIYKQISASIPVFSWTPEMGRRRERNVLLSIHTGLPVAHIIDYRMSDDPENTFKILKQGIEDFKKFPYYVQDQFIDSAEHFIKSFEGYIKENNIKIVYLDNADNIRNISNENESAKKSYTIQSSIRRFQDFSKTLELHICCMWQLNRDAVDKRTGKIREKALDSATSFSDTVNQIVDVHLSVQKDTTDTYSGIGDGVSKVRSAKARGGLHNQNTIVLLVRDKFGERLYSEKEVELLGRSSEDIPLPEEESFSESVKQDVDIFVQEEKEMPTQTESVPLDNPFIQEREETFEIKYSGSDEFTADDIYNFKIIQEKEYVNNFKKTKQLQNTNVYDLNRWKQIRSEKINLNKEIYQTLIKRIKSGVDTPLSLLDKLLPEKAFSLLSSSGLEKSVPEILCSFDIIDTQLILLALPYLDKYSLLNTYLEFAEKKYNQEGFQRLLQIIENEGYKIPIRYWDNAENSSLDKENVVFSEEDSPFGEVIVD